MSSFGPAERPRTYVLWTPWALFDLTREPGSTGRRPLSLEAPVEVPAGSPLILAVPAGARVDIDGRRLRAQRETNAFDLGHHRYMLYSLCIGTRDEGAPHVRGLRQARSTQPPSDSPRRRTSWTWPFTRQYPF